MKAWSQHAARHPPPVADGVGHRPRRGGQIAGDEHRERLAPAVHAPLAHLPLRESDREALVEYIGKYALNEVHRQLLLSATTELWVDYLTRIEALRVSIGLEAYAQPDPLVQYKGRASEMFTQLVEDIRGLAEECSPINPDPSRSNQSK